MKIIPNTHFCSKNLIECREESYTETAKRYLDNIISIIASYAPLITFCTTLLYTIPEIEAYAIIKDSTTTTTTPEPDQVDIRLIPFPTTTPCPYPQMGSRATDIKICYKPPERWNSYMTSPKNCVTTIVNKVIKCTRLITSLITIGAIFSLFNQIEARYIPYKKIQTRTTTFIPDDVKIVPILKAVWMHEKKAEIYCGILNPWCRKGHSW